MGSIYIKMIYKNLIYIKNKMKHHFLNYYKLVLNFFINYVLTNKYYILIYIFYINNNLLIIKVINYIRIIFSLYNMIYNNTINTEQVKSYFDPNILVNGKAGDQSESNLANSALAAPATPAATAAPATPAAAAAPDTPAVTSAPDTNDQPSQINNTACISDAVRDKYGISQPDNSQGNLSNCEWGQRLSDYLNVCKKYKQELIDLDNNPTKKKSTVYLTRVGLTEHNKDFIKTVIRDRMDCYCHDHLGGVQGNKLSNVSVTKEVLRILKQVR